MSTAMSQTTIFDDTVASKIELLLARCEGVRRGSDLHVLFDERGEREARAIAAADAQLAPKGRVLTGFWLPGKPSL
jgi:hypothetical protein